MKENKEEVVGDEMSIGDRIHNSDDEIIMFSEHDLDKKLIAVNMNNKVVSFDIINLVKTAIDILDDSSEILTVANITLNKL